MIPIVDLKRQYKQTGEEIEKAVVDVFRSGVLIFWALIQKRLSKNFLNISAQNML